MLSRRYSIEQEALRKAVRQIRTASKVTQQSLADHLGVPQSFVSKYESGEKTLTFVDLHFICKALGIEFTDFYKRFLRQIDATKP